MDVSEGYAKMAIAMYNSNLPEGYHPLTMKDLDNLSSDNMLKLVIMLISEFECVTNLSEKKSSLPQFDQFGCSSGLTYDSTADHVYIAAKKYFADDNDLLDLSVLLLPGQEPKRTKQVISYLTEFVIFCDQLNEPFQAEWEKLNQENQEKSELYTEIDAIKNQIAEKIRDMQNKEDRKPQLEADLTAIDQEILREQEVLADLESEAKVAKKTYDSKAADNHKLAAKLQALDDEKASLESQIVTNAADLIQEFKHEQEQFKKESNTREILGKELKQLGTQEQFLVDLIDKSLAAIKRFEKLMEAMQAAGENMSANNKCQTQYKEKLKEIEELEKASVQLNLQRQRLESDYKKRSRTHHQMLNKLENSLKEKQEKLESLESNAKKNERICTEMNIQIREVQEKIEAMHAEVKEHIYFVEVEIPQRNAALEQLTEDNWRAIYKLFEEEVAEFGNELSYEYQK